MTDTAIAPDTPRRILLATDLSARCDRALERAVALAVEWNAQLTILHVFERVPDVFGKGPDLVLLPSWQRPPDAVAAAKRRIRRILRTDLGDALERATVLVEDGEAADVILRVAAVEQSELIVTGVAHDEPFARRPVRLGTTVESLLRRSPAPLLIVADRPRGPYGHIVVAVDLSAVSAHALQVALQHFPRHTLRLLHAFEPPHAGHASDPARYVQDHGAALARDLEAFLDPLALQPHQRARLEPLIERGLPAALVRQYVHDHDADLVVLGTRGRGAVMEALVGSTAKSILAVLPCDALVVREPAAGG